MKNLAIFVFIGLLVSSCGANSEIKEMRDRIDELEAILLADTVSQLNRSKAQELIQAYEHFANAVPEDSLTPEYLYKSAEIAMNLNMSGRAIENYQRILNNYQDFDKRAYCIFLQAFVYENQMQQYETARKLYELFINQYPDHDLADDARVSIDNMGKSLEELIKSWEEKEK